MGARLSGAIARRRAHLPEAAFDLEFVGQAGQSFGVFNNRGMRLTLIGEAQDYVGKGMAGGTLVLRPDVGSAAAAGAVILGNTAASGAPGGELSAAGAAAARLAVRNSGATVVVEGCGDHGCEYMTGGSVLVLGRTGLNFAAGMSGGEAYVLDHDGDLRARVNPAMVDFGPLTDDEAYVVRALVERHLELTGSAVARELLRDWKSAHDHIFAIRPRRRARVPSQRSA